MNRIQQLFRQKNENILTVYLTAGYPNLSDTLSLCLALQEAGVDMIEIGMPFSDPLADGPVIQQSSQVALANGMSISKLFEQLKNMRSQLHIPILLMGYYNPVLQYGIERFCADCQRVGIDGLIIPDLPFEQYRRQYAKLFEQHRLSNVFLITPQTTHERIHLIDQASTGFIYMVSSASTTGSKAGISAAQHEYFQRINAMQLQHPRLIGFGISDAQTYQTACAHSQGAIIGSALIKAIDAAQPAQSAAAFIQSIR